MRVLAMAALLLAGCRESVHPPLALAEDVDLGRFMGDWYVIANIPTAIEKGAHNAVESYRLEEDGTIATTFTRGALTASRASPRNEVKATSASLII